MFDTYYRGVNFTHNLREILKLLQNKGIIEDIDWLQLDNFYKDYYDISINELTFKSIKILNENYELKQEIADLKHDLDRERTIQNSNLKQFNIMNENLSKKILKMQNLIKDLYTEAGL